MKYSLWNVELTAILLVLGACFIAIAIMGERLFSWVAPYFNSLLAWLVFNQVLIFGTVLALVQLYSLGLAVATVLCMYEDYRTHRGEDGWPRGRFNTWVPL